MADYQADHADHADHPEELPEPHRVIRVGHFDDPVSVITDTEAWQARDAYPDLGGRGPLFAVTEQEADGRWRILLADEGNPQGCRDALASECRRRAKEAEEAGDTGAHRAWMAGATSMEWEKLNDLTVRDCRFRIARGDMFLRTGPDGPEPPRPSDPDPMPVGEGRDARSRTKGFLIDPTAATGMSEGILKLDLLQFVYARTSVPREVHEDSVRAQHTHPGGVLLPTAFTVSERMGDRWGADDNLSHETPQGARDYLADRFEALLPRSLRPAACQDSRFPELPEPLREELARRHNLLKPGTRRLTKIQLRECAAVVTRLHAERLDDIEALGHRYRITRLERLVRLGPDGPEPPRPSDWDPYDPIAVQTEKDREKGLM
jgi:hypothetical protein